MKKLYIAIFVPALISLIASAVLIPMMPETVPAHYNISGEADRMGSRYETLIFPAITLLSSAFMAIVARKRRGTSEEKPLLIVGVATTVLFMLIGIFFSVKALTHVPAAPGNADVYRILLLVMGIFLVIAGNIMPKVRRNSFFGLRTPWSLKNDETWRKCQRFGGISAVICGLIMIATAIFTGGVTAMVILVILIVMWSVLSIVMSYKYSKE